MSIISTRFLLLAIFLFTVGVIYSQPVEDSAAVASNAGPIIPVDEIPEDQSFRVQYRLKRQKQSSRGICVGRGRDTCVTACILETATCTYGYCAGYGDCRCTRC